MPKRREKIGAKSQKKRDEEITGITPESIIQYFRKARRTNHYWKPSKTIARYLGIPYQRLIVSQNKDHLDCLLWTTVLVVIHCTTHMAENQSLWQGMVNDAIEWLFHQPMFEDTREDLVRSACSVFSMCEPNLLLEEGGIFATRVQQPNTLSNPLGDWVECFLQEPPYTVYYWNQKTNRTQWKHPIQAAEEKKLAFEIKTKRQDKINKALPMRIKINRDRLPSEKIILCMECKSQSPQEAQIQCIACEGRFFCDDCCDQIHSHRKLVHHIDTSFRFRECFGKFGFPKQKNTASC
jgi:hypothetical protein